MNTTNPAGFWIRFLASFLDSLILSIPVGFMTFMVYGTFTTESLNPIEVMELLYYLLVPILWMGYTLGKRIVNIRIVRVDGKKLGLGTMLMRYVVSTLVYILTLGIGMIVSAFMVGLREDKRAIHDFIAGTYVTYNPPSENEGDVPSVTSETNEASSVTKITTTTETTMETTPKENGATSDEMKDVAVPAPTASTEESAKAAPDHTDTNTPSDK